ncbi:MAG TPA: hypothetical protein DD666_09925 [Advenella kashmirensis]|uniref:DUF4476 domain-containing protein n=1 Tax=Advenella kashmirensis TaxID=310575 RepID=A0A356LFC5_9BURK|nr:hypothetical protein [Advenella kashmirensis]
MKIFLLILSLTVFMTNTHAQATPEQKAYVEKMTPTQLYNSYTNFVINELVKQIQPQGIVLSDVQKLEIGKCTRSILVEEFTTNEIRTMFIQPSNMDRTYYNKKLDHASNEIQARCKNLFIKQ